MTVRLVIWTLVALYIGMAHLTPAQALDPYADSDRQMLQQQYAEEREEFLSTIKVLYFAVGCKVLPGEGSIAPYIFRLGRAFDAQANRNRIYRSEIESMKAAASEGAERSKLINACDYWRDHPEMVREVRAMIGY